MAVPRPRALVVDDTESIRSLVCNILEDRGFEVHAAAGGSAALRRLVENGVDLVVTDWHMPGLGGAHVVSAARELLAGVPVIVVTADPVAATAGIDPDDLNLHLLEKPFTVAAFVGLVERVCRPSRRR